VSERSNSPDTPWADFQTKRKSPPTERLHLELC